MVNLSKYEFWKPQMVNSYLSCQWSSTKRQRYKVKEWKDEVESVLLATLLNHTNVDTIG